jgi:hypothetical protein
MTSPFLSSYFYCCYNIWFSIRNLQFIICSDYPVILILLVTLGHHKSTLFEWNGTRMLVLNHLSACISMAPFNRFLWVVMGWGLHKKPSRNSKFCQNGQNIGHFTCGPKYAVLLLATLNCYNSTLFQWTGIRL